MVGVSTIHGSNRRIHSGPGVVALLLLSDARPVLWMAFGLLRMASGMARSSELARQRRHAGALGALAWLTAPHWGKNRDLRPPR